MNNKNEQVKKECKENKKRPPKYYQCRKEVNQVIRDMLNANKHK